MPSPSNSAPLALSWREMRQRGAAWWASRVTLESSISITPYGPCPGRSQPRRGFHLPFTRIVPDNSEITALICYIDIVLIDSCSIVSPRVDKGGTEKRGNGEGSITKRKDGRWM